MLPRHPDTYSPEELEQWIRHLVDQQVPEGKRLDYKEEPNLSPEKGRREAAKDITSFANEVGGVILYGMPEKRTEKKEPIPDRPYGMDPVPGLESQLENIYVDTIRPNLGEYKIARVPLSEYEGKVVYLVWTPESWLGPHMVEAYGDHKYYRRGQFRAVEMAEHEVRDRYQRIQRTGERLEKFLSSPEVNFPAPLFFDSPTCGSHYLVAPRMLYDRIDFTRVDTRGWLQMNLYPSAGEQWRPFSAGVRTRLRERVSSDAEDGIIYRDFVQFFRNGALSHWSETRTSVEEDDWLLIASVSELEKVAEFLAYAGKVLDMVGYAGPVHVQGTIRSSKRELRLASSGSRDEWPRLLAPDGAVRITFEQPSRDLITNSKTVLRRVADEMFRAFERWSAAALFDEEGNLRFR